MDFYIFLTLTAFAVSIDSMMAGFAMGLKTKKVLFFAISVAMATLLLCYASILLCMLIDDVLENIMQKAGSFFLIATGIANCCKKSDDSAQAINLKESIALSFAVGLDAGIANLSICLLGYTQLWIPFIFAFMHFATVSIGAKIANTQLIGKLKNTNKLSGAILIALGIFKLLQ